MRSHRRRRLAQPPPWRRPPPPELMDDAIAEILLRLPPDDPACLVRASLVCKLWHGILSEPTFPDRYRELHRTPPLLGFLFASYSYVSRFGGDSGCFASITATRVPFRHPAYGCRALDCRHGRVLLHEVDVTGPGATGREFLAVWDPVTGDLKALGDPDPVTDTLSIQSGAVLCAAPGCCNHRGCGHGGGGPFQVLCVSTSSTNSAMVYAYSSETAAWSTPPASVEVQCDGKAFVEKKRPAIVGDLIYFLLGRGAGILEYDLGERCLTVIVSPCTFAYGQPGVLMAMEEDGSLGLAGVNKDDFSSLHLWRWRGITKVNPNGSSMGWVRERVISLNSLVPVTRPKQLVDVAGFAEGEEILLLSVGESGRGIMFELRSGRIRKLSKPAYFYYGNYFPYLSFYIPDFASQQKYPLPAKTK